jgi:predicted DNA-binding protein
VAGAEWMTAEGKYTKTLKIRIDPELYEQLKEEAKRLNTDVSTYVRWCIQTGIYLKDLNTFIKSKGGEQD